MAGHQIGELEKLLGVKAYVLRYWERQIPFIQPRKDDFGRRVYNSKDISLLLRLRYLLYVRRFTIDGAKAEILREASGAEDAKAVVNAARADLLQAFFATQRLAKKSTKILRLISDLRAQANRPASVR